MDEVAKVTPPIPQETQDQSFVDPLAPAKDSKDVKPYTQYSPEELKELYDKGSIDTQLLNYVVLKKMVASGLQTMNIDDVKEARQLNIINDTDVDNYIKRRMNPFQFYAEDIGTGVIHGAVSLADSVNNAGIDFVSYLGLMPEKLPYHDADSVEQPKTIAGHLASGLTQFSGMFVPASKGLEALSTIPKLAEISTKFPAAYEAAKVLVAGATSDFFAFDPNRGGHLADWLHELGAGNIPVLGAVVESLKSDPNSNAAHERLKQALEGAYTGLVADLFMKMLSVVGASIWKNCHGDVSSVNKYVNDLLPKPTDENNIDLLSALSAKYESGGDSAAIGWDAKGGTSYGKYQIASKPGTFDAFLKFLDDKAPELAEKLRASGPPDTGSIHGTTPRVWKALAQEGKIQEFEKAFIMETHYKPAYKALDPEVKSFVDETPGMKEVLFSHSLSGPAYAKDFNIAYAETIAKGKTVEDFIDHVYDLRLTHFKGENYELVKRRFEVAEREDAKRLILGEVDNRSFIPEVRANEGEKSQPKVINTDEATASIPAQEKEPTIVQVYKNDIEHGEAILEALGRKEMSEDRGLFQGPDFETSSIINRYRAEKGDMQDVVSAVYQASKDRIRAAKQLGMTVDEMYVNALKGKKLLDDIYTARKETTEAAAKGKEMEGLLAYTFLEYDRHKRAIEALADNVDSLTPKQFETAKALFANFSDLLTNVESIRSSTSRMMNMMRGRLSDRFEGVLRGNPAIDADGIETIKRSLKLFKQAKNDKARAVVAKNMSDYKWLRLTLQFAQANLLWGPATHIVNMVSQLASFTNDEMLVKWGAIAYEAARTGQLGLLKQVEVEAHATVVGVLQALRIPGVFSKLFTGKVDEFFSGLKGDKSQLGNVWKALWSGEAVTDSIKKLDSYSLEHTANFEVAGLNLPVGTILTFPFRGLTAADEGFSSVVMHKTIAGGLFEQGYKEGLRGQELKNFISEYMSHPPEELIKEGIERKRNITFTQVFNDRWAKGATMFANSFPGLVGRLSLMPFWRITANILNAGVEHSPLAPFSTAFKTAWETGGRARYEAVGKVATGLAALTAGYALAESGAYIGEVPNDIKNTFTMANVPSYSYRKDDGTWTDGLNNLGPISLLINTGANIHAFLRYRNSIAHDDSIEEDEKLQKIVSYGALICASPVMQMHWNTMVRDLSNAVNGTMNWTKFGLKEVEKLLPGETLTGHLTRLFDPYTREVNSFWDLIKSKYFMSDQLLPRRDPVFGEPLDSISKGLDGSTQRKDRLDDPVIRELFRVGVGPGKPSDDLSLGGVKIKLDPKEKDQILSSISSLKLRDTLGTLIESPGYKQLSGNPTEQAKMLRGIISHTRKAAYSMSLTQNPAELERWKSSSKHFADTLLGSATDPSPTSRVTKLLELIQDTH